MKLVLEMTDEMREEFKKEMRQLYLNTINQARLDVVANKEVLTIEEACEVLGITRNTLKDNFIRKGLPQYKIGNRLYINKRELYQFIKQHQI